MADELMYFPNDYTPKYPICRLLCGSNVWTLNEPTNQNSLKSHKLLSQPIRTRYYKTLVTSIINRLMSPPSLNLRVFLTVVNSYIYLYE